MGGWAFFIYEKWETYAGAAYAFEMDPSGRLTYGMPELPI
jgi:hypothetical protein